MEEHTMIYTKPEPTALGKPVRVIETSPLNQKPIKVVLKTAYSLFVPIPAYDLDE
jgi:hypothetical protein